MDLLEVNLLKLNLKELTDYLNHERIDKLHSITTMRFCYQLYTFVLSHRNTKYWFDICQTLINLKTTLTGRGHDHLLVSINKYNSNDFFKILIVLVMFCNFEYFFVYREKNGLWTFRNDK